MGAPMPDNVRKEIIAQLTADRSPSSMKSIAQNFSYSIRVVQEILKKNLDMICGSCVL
jgi:hypothetical protein